MPTDTIDVEVEIEPRERKVDHAIGVNAPAVGAELSYQVTRRLKLDAVSALFTASAAAANRIPALKITFPGGAVALLAPVSVAITAAQAVQVTWGRSLGTVGNSTAQTIGLPQLILPENAVIATVTAAKDAGDAYTNVVVTGQYEK